MSQTATKARLILFNGPMVRAILDGRKTQTRRVCKFTSGGHLKEPGGNRRWHRGDPDAVLACPYGVPGDRLWCRECWGYLQQFREHDAPNCGEVVYRADGEPSGPDIRGTAWRPSIHMPRWASRITLEVLSVRVERVQEISESDAAAEGFHREGCGGEGNTRTFARTWDSIIGKKPGHAWADNPWVWVVEFRRVDQ